MIYPAMAGIGFAAGALHFGGAHARSAAGAGLAGARSLEAWAAAQPAATAAGGERPGRDGFEDAMRSKRGGLGSALRTHLELVRDTPLGELPELLLRYERSMPGGSSESAGSLVRAAIVERLLAEDPDSLLQLALSGRSEHLDSNQQSMIRGLRGQMGYETLARKIASGGIPANKIRLMESLLGQEIAESPERGWELAVSNGRVDLDRLARENPGLEAIEHVLLTDSMQRLADDTIQLCFRSALIDTPATALEMIDSIEQLGERLAAVSGIGASIGDNHSPVDLQVVAKALRSDQERLAFYQAALAEGTHPWANTRTLGGDLEAILKIDHAYVRQALLDQQLRTWKALAPSDARAWAEDHGQLERYEGLQVVAFPVIPAGFDPSASGVGSEFVPPEIPADPPFTPPVDGNGEEP